MKLLLVISSIVVPIVMLYLQQKSNQFKMLFNIVATISIIIFGSLASMSIYQVIIDDAVFMTTIHGLFLNPVFLVTGAYLGTFVIYRLMMLTLDER
ncbi:transposase [Solibacillus sp. R5-41]|uniref:transposase n=1 Tax=Solibacillus sp. R5-41 TaxID=2048654 RepID=UPI000C12907E|nr:transposase [Solibacillus sp. R5-41]ATP39918.1 transposase [Solibacillus sp. R5-41]